MRALLDTHAALWWLAGDDRLSPTARDAIATADEPLVSAGTLFEVAIKASLDKLRVPQAWAEQLLAEGFSLLPITAAHASALRELPYVEVAGSEIRDPFDRLLVAQSAVERVPLITCHAAIRSHGVAVVW